MKKQQIKKAPSPGTMKLTGFAPWLCVRKITQPSTSKALAKGEIIVLTSFRAVSIWYYSHMLPQPN